METNLDSQLEKLVNIIEESIGAKKTNFTLRRSHLKKYFEKNLGSMSKNELNTILKNMEIIFDIYKADILRREDIFKVPLKIQIEALFLIGREFTSLEKPEFDYLKKSFKKMFSSFEKLSEYRKKYLTECGRLSLKGRYLKYLEVYTYIRTQYPEIKSLSVFWMLTEANNILAPNKEYQIDPKSGTMKAEIYRAKKSLLKSIE